MRDFFLIPCFVRDWFSILLDQYSFWYGIFDFGIEQTCQKKYLVLEILITEIVFINCIKRNILVITNFTVNRHDMLSLVFRSNCNERSLIVCTSKGYFLFLLIAGVTSKNWSKSKTATCTKTPCTRYINLVQNQRLDT